jgi:hypothetical protein
MNMNRCIEKMRNIFIACAGLALTSAAAHAQQDVLIPGGPIEYTVEPLDGGKRDFLFAFAQDAEAAAKAPANEYWLGLQVAAVPELVKKHLGIEHGLAVGEVVEDSPAAKADIRRHDILTKAEDAPLADLDDLVKAVEASEGKEITIKILRSGKEQSARVTAAKRPPTQRLDVRMAPPPEIAEEIRRVEDALQKLKAKAGDRGLGLYIPRPGFVMPQGDVLRHWSLHTDGKKADFPSDLSVRITKEGDQPAKINVKRGDKEWNVTEEKLDELPEDIRTHVQRFLGKGGPLTMRMPAAAVIRGGDRALRVTPEGKVEGELHVRPFPPGAPVPPAAPRPPMPPRAAGEPQARVFSYRSGSSEDDPKLEAILKELRDLRKELDEVRKAQKN